MMMNPNGNEWYDAPVSQEERGRVLRILMVSQLRPVGEWFTPEGEWKLRKELMEPI